eukprot:SAG11_NODE_5777_length_1465_cov_12.692533_1_plen_65_part_00
MVFTYATTFYVHIDVANRAEGSKNVFLRRKGQNFRYRYEIPVVAEQLFSRAYICETTVPILKMS